MEIILDPTSDDRALIMEIALDRYRGDASVLSVAEQARFRRMRSTAKRRDFLAGRSAMRRVVGELIEIEPRDVRIEYGAHGKPEIAGHAGLHFNLSHSGDRALLAVSRHGPVGVDIEAARSGRPFRRLARRFFASAEYEWLEGLPGGRVADGFYRLWTLKEAYLKAIGTGLTLPSNAFQVDPESDPPRLVSTSAGQLAAEHWAMQALSTEPGYHAALCMPAGVLDYRQMSIPDR